MPGNTAASSERAATSAGDPARSSLGYSRGNGTGAVPGDDGGGGRFRRALVMRGIRLSLPGA
jgi:hypothetical protein